MRFRKLRIAWSVVCAIVCVLLVVLWIRSLQVSDLFSTRGAGGVTTTLCSSSGKLWYRRGGDSFQVTLRGRSVPASDWHYLRLDIPGNAEPQWYVFRSNATALKIQIPDAALIAVCIALGITPWIRWRFKLRTLLIATTLVAVGLGLTVVYFNHH
jgi:hypothetical protein